MTSPAILRYAAFTDTPEGGNPAGVVLDASGLSDAEMLKIAADLGYSGSAFVTERGGGGSAVRPFSPEAEAGFCDPAATARGVALAQCDGAGRLVSLTQAGAGRVDTEGPNGDVTATLTSVVPY